MSSRRLLALLSFLGAVIPAASHAELRQHGNVIFDLPKGWVMGTTRDDGTLVMLSRLPDDQCEYCYIYVGAGVDRAEDPAQYLTQNTRLFLDKDDPDPQEVVPINTFELGPHKGAILGQKEQSAVRVLMAVSLENRTEVFGFQGHGDSPEQVQESVDVFERDLVNMVNNARFVSDGVKPVMEPAEPGDLTGVYQGSGQRWSLGMDMMMQSTTYVNLYVFWKDGLFYRGTPPEGLKPLDTQAALKAGDMSWGSYHVRNGKLHLSYADGHSEDFDADGDVRTGFSCDQTICAPVQSIADNSKLDGTVDNFNYSGFSPASGVSGGVSTSSTLTFNPDGTWSYKSSTGASGNFDTGGGYAVSGGNQADGSYKVQNGNVTRSFNDGRPDQTSLIYQIGKEIMIGNSFFSGHIVQ